MDKTQDHVHLLVLCIKNNNNGRPDFGKVGAAMGMTKNAARLRYSSIMKKYDVAKDDDPKVGKAKAGNAKVENTKAKKAQTPVVKSESGSPKKRKIKAEESEEDESEDELSIQSEHKPVMVRPRRNAVVARKIMYVESEDSEDSEEVEEGGDDEDQMSMGGEPGEEVEVNKDEADCA